MTNRELVALIRDLWQIDHRLVLWPAAVVVGWFTFLFLLAMTLGQ